MKSDFNVQYVRQDIHAKLQQEYDTLKEDSLDFEVWLAGDKVIDKELIKTMREVFLRDVKYKKKAP